ncbi:MAG TPA: hypothetical protein VL988_10290 [Solirubrobacteraceae bacterium]|nr:hypothetical protein [Solirubrobacteraceae bacterium]
MIATIALVFAMTGGAYAAKRYLISSTNQISPKVLKALKGASGKQGPAGPAGPVGPAGSAGTGSAGAAGPAGPAGPIGTQGEKGLQGEKGTKGEKGPEGSPWTAGGVLPSGKSETGTFALNPTTGAVTRASISFPIPLPGQQCEIEPGPPPVFLEQGICGEDHIHVFFEEASIPNGCTGTVVEGLVTNLKADPGNFCAWVQFASGTTLIVPLDPETGGPGIGITGAIMQANPSGSAAVGTWAVTAP